MITNNNVNSLSHTLYLLNDAAISILYYVTKEVLNVKESCARTCNKLVSVLYIIVCESH